MSVAVENLIPHRAPMRWIDALTACTDTTATATACFNDGHFAVANGAVSEAALVECMAQTVAAALGHRAKTRETSSNLTVGGMLVAVSNFRVQSRPPVGKNLDIEVRELKRFGLMLLVSGKITCDGQPIASGELTLYA